MAKATAQIEISAGTSRLASGLAAAKNAFMTWGAATARGIGAAFKKVNKALEPGDTMKNAAGHLGGELMGRGLDAITDAAGEVRDFERNLVRLQIATDGNAASTANMRKVMGQVSRETGIARAEVLAGASAYVGFTGDAAGAADAAGLFARVAAATGSSTADVAQAMSALKSSMNITAKEGEAAFSALIVQGKGGAVEVKDMAGELAGLAPKFALFKGGQGVEGLRELGAGFQVIMKNSATASDAATKYSALMSSLNDPRTRKELKSMGVEVVDSNGKLLDASTVFQNLADSKKLFTKTNLSKAFGRDEARLAVLALKEHIGTYRELRDAAQDTGAVQRDMNTFLESDAGRLDRAFNDMKLAVSEAFTPERIRGFVNAVEGLADKLAPVIGFIGQAADKLGTLVNVGKSIRGSIGGNGGRSFIDKAADEALANYKPSNMDILSHGKTAPSAMRIAGAKSRLADDAAREAAQAAILAGEKDERTSPESIRRAVLAANSGRQYGQGRIGESQAGEQYLRAAGVSSEERSKIEQQILADAMRDAVPAAIRDGFLQVAQNLAAPPTVQIGDNQVARSVTKSTQARRGAP